MLGLFGTLNLGTRALQTQQAAVEVTGQNLANVNNPAYARQRVQIQTSITIQSALGPQGTGADAVAIQQIRDSLLDEQIRSEESVGGYWNAQQRSFQNAQSALGEFLDRGADGVNSAAGTGTGVGASGLADQLTGLFNAFQSVAVSPTTLEERQALVSQAQSLATSFNQVAQRFSALSSTLDASVTADVASANTLLANIANLNDQIARAELSGGGVANDLRDTRQEKLEALAKLVNFDTSTASDGSLNITINGTSIVEGNRVAERLETYTSGGRAYVQTAATHTPLDITGGSIAGTIEARDVTLAGMRSGLDNLAATLIAQVNGIHAAGFSPGGSTGANFFSGTDAATIGVNSALVDDPMLVQAAGTPGVSGENSIASTLAKLATQPSAALGNQTFSSAYHSIVSGLGSALKGANDQLASHDAVTSMLLKQRDSISGVSIDEEMTNLLTYQKGYQAAAKIVATIDEMLDTVLNLKR